MHRHAYEDYAVETRRRETTSNAVFSAPSRLCGNRSELTPHWADKNVRPPVEIGEGPPRFPLPSYWSLVLGPWAFPRRGFFLPLSCSPVLPSPLSPRATHAAGGGQFACRDFPALPSRSRYHATPSTFATVRRWLRAIRHRRPRHVPSFAGPQPSPPAPYHATLYAKCTRAIIEPNGMVGDVCFELPSRGPSQRHLTRLTL